MLNRFIQRPILSIVVSLLIVFLGLLSYASIPVTQFPSISPPKVTVVADYPGANNELLIKAVVIPLERAINGTPGLKYIASDAGNDGEANIQVVFNLGTDPNDADSDDDGLLDGLEPNYSADSDGDGLINPLDPDSDNDGLFDGTEMGKGCGNAATDVSKMHCVADADGGATKTSPLLKDTDGGGVSDGNEDTNKNGSVDPGERNPTAGHGETGATSTADSVDPATSSGAAIATRSEKTSGCTIGSVRSVPAGGRPGSVSARHVQVRIDHRAARRHRGDRLFRARVPDRTPPHRARSRTR